MAITPLEAIQAIETGIREHARTSRNRRLDLKRIEADFFKSVEIKLNAAIPEASELLNRLTKFFFGDHQQPSSPRLAIAGVVSDQGESDSEVKPTNHLSSEGLSKADLLVLRYYCYELLRRANPVRDNVLNQIPDDGARAMLDEIKQTLNKLNGIRKKPSENANEAYSNFHTSYAAIFSNLRLVLNKFKRELEFNFMHSRNADNLWK